MTRRDATTDTLPHEFAINAAERTHELNAHHWADGPGAPCEGSRTLSREYDRIWNAYRAGTINEDERDAALNALLS